MIFFWPHLLWLLVPVFLLAAADTVRSGSGESSRPWPKILRAWAGPRQAVIGNGHRSPRGRLLLWSGLAFGIVALARPQWGRVEEPVFDQSREIVIALDLSRSMLAPDVRPSRLERARLLIQSLLDGLRGERVGLVVFAGTAFLQVPLSADYEILNQFLPSLNPAFMPAGGTNYEAMLHTALDAFGASGTADRFLIILSDGESEDDRWRGLVSDLKQKNIRVLGLGVGTVEGAFIPDESGRYVKDERGAVVLSKLNSATLQELASATNGVYTDASTWIDLASLLKQTVAAGHRGEFTERIQVRQIERFQWLLVPALLCLLISLWREFPVRPQVRNLPLAATTARPAQPPASRWPASAGAAARAILFAIVSLALLRTSAPAAEDTSVYAAPLSKLVEQLSNQPELSATDYSTLAQETITWGKRLREANQPVTPGPVRDALTGVDAGEKLARQAADWAQYRSQLEGLLKKPPEPPPQQQPQNQQQKEPQQQSQESPKPQPPPPQPDQGNPGETQKIGGHPRQPPAKADPSLALPIQKLDQLRNQDSPAELFQMLDSRERKPPPKKGRDW